MPHPSDSQPGRWPTDEWDTYPPRRRWKRIWPQAGLTVLRLAVVGATLLVVLVVLVMWLANCGAS